MTRISNHISIIVAALALLCSCNLEFSPTDSGSSADLFFSASKAITVEDGIYRSMWTAGWSTGSNSHQCFGISAYALAQEAMGDDFIMQNSGNGWFWYDHVYNVKDFNDSDSWRSYDVWYAYYVWISNANYIISYADEMEGSEEDKAYVLGQAYAIRALSYLNLASWFARAPYNPLENRGRWDDPGVPIYTTRTDKNFEGKPRASLREVYAQVDSDIDTAIELLRKGESSSLMGNNSRINLYSALVIKSRAALVEGRWKEAADAAVEVVESGHYSIGIDLMSGMNNGNAGNVIWAAIIENTEQSGMYAGFFTHMDNQDGAYAESSPKLISSALYAQMGENDVRRGWWDPDDKVSPYISHKFRFSNVSSWMGDYIYMRIEEMYLTAAEAYARLGDEKKAASYLQELMDKRDKDFRASAKTGVLLGGTTNSWTGSLLESILVQRRIELWGEYGRVFDVKRLGQGIVRTTADGFSSDCIKQMGSVGADLSNPETFDWVLTIPQDEINANDKINEGDQNPS